MIVQFASPRIETAMACFYEEFSRETLANGFVSFQRIRMSEAAYTFDDDLFIREVRAWVAGALTCGLVSSFRVEMV